MNLKTGKFTRNARIYTIPINGKIPEYDCWCCFSETVTSGVLGR